MKSVFFFPLYTWLALNRKINFKHIEIKIKIKCATLRSSNFRICWRSLGINFASGCASAFPPREERICSRWYFIQMVTVKSIDDFERLIASSAQTYEHRAICKRRDVPTSFPMSKLANRWRLHAWRNILREPTLYWINDSLRIYEQTFDWTRQRNKFNADAIAWENSKFW